MAYSEDYKALLDYPQEEQDEAVELLEKVAGEMRDLALHLKNPAWKSSIAMYDMKFYLKPDIAYDLYQLSKDIWEVMDYVCEDEIEDMLQEITEMMDKIISDDFRANYIDYSIYYLTQKLWKCELILLKTATYLLSGGRI